MLRRQGRTTSFTTFLVKPWCRRSGAPWTCSPIRDSLHRSRQQHTARCAARAPPGRRPAPDLPRPRPAAQPAPAGVRPAPVPPVRAPSAPRAGRHAAGACRAQPSGRLPPNAPQRALQQGALISSSWGAACAAQGPCSHFGSVAGEGGMNIARCADARPGKCALVGMPCPARDRMEAALPVPAAAGCRPAACHVRAVCLGLTEACVRR